MIPALAYIVAAYAIARLIQVPVEAWEPETPGQAKSRSAVLVLVSLVGILAVLMFVVAIEGKAERATERMTNLLK